LFHISLHFIIPLLIAVAFYRSKWFKSWLIMSLTMLVDLDHLLANPIYDPNRCSIGFHPMHQPVMFVVYVVLLLFPKTRLIGLGLLVHIVLDGLDCQFM
jgi:hypothetical protein